MRDEGHQSAQANEIAEQLLDVEMIAVHRSKRKGFCCTSNKLEAQKTEALAAIGGFINVARRIKYGQFELVQSPHILVADALDDFPKLIDRLAARNWNARHSLEVIARPPSIPAH